MPAQKVITCSCCQLPQLVPDLDGGGRPASLCARCWGHRGADPTKTLQCAQDHEAMLRERLAAAREAADKAHKERDVYKEKMHAAYGSRENGVRYLRKVNNLHILKPDGRCSCGMRRGCRTAEVIYTYWVQSMIQKLDEIEKQREAELAAADFEEDWTLTLWDRYMNDDGTARTA